MLLIMHLILKKKKRKKKKNNAAMVGVLIGLAVPGRKKRPAAWAASLVFVAAYVPLMGKFLPYLLGDRVAIEDIYR